MSASLLSPEQIKQLISSGETSTVQFKQTINSAKQLAEEFVAFSNTLGGYLLIGVSDDGRIVGLDNEAIRQTNQWVANAATESVKPNISPLTQTIELEQKNILVVEIKEGIYKPYATAQGIYYIKTGSDKRIVSQEELQRMFQESHKFYADEMSVLNSSFNDINMDLLKKFINKKYEINLELSALKQILNNLNMAQGELLTLAGLLLFGTHPQKFRPDFLIKAVYFVGDDISSTEYIDNETIEGNLAELFEGAFKFISRNLRKKQPAGEGFNSVPILEIPREVLEEILVNALVHRDYFINAPVKIFIFNSRIEIINPGKLPNSLSIENIRSGQSVSRNPVLLSNAQYLLPYKGLGSGIPRALKFYKDIEFINDRSGDQFKVIIKRN